jgi:4-hydroxybenzoyl-CoA thioesterase
VNVDDRGKPFSSDLLIRFQHCDPAGLVFYPRYFVMINQVTEDWFADMGVDFRDLHLNQKVGVPAVRTECDFLAPSRMGDLLTFELSVTDLGRSSINLEIVARSDAQDRLRARLVLAYVALGDPVRSAPIPDALRATMETYRVRRERTELHDHNGGSRA